MDPNAGWGRPASPPKQKSFWQKRGGEIVAGVIIAVVGAAAIASVGPASGTACKVAPLPFCPPTLSRAFLGNWQVVQTEGQSLFSSFPGATIEPVRLQLVDDETYTMTVRTSLDPQDMLNQLDPSLNQDDLPIAFPAGTNQEVSFSGRYRVIDADTIELANADGNGVAGRFDLSLDGGMLRMKDTARPSTTIFQRSGS